MFQCAMARHHQAPWRTDEQLIEVLEMERAALAEQVAAIREGRDIDADEKRELVLLCRYIVLGSSKRVADWANRKGWRLPGAEARGGRPANPPRQYTSDDVLRLVKTPPSNLPVSFGDLLQDVFNFRPD